MCLYFTIWHYILPQVLFVSVYVRRYRGYGAVSKHLKLFVYLYAFCVVHQFINAYNKYLLNSCYVYRLCQASVGCGRVFKNEHVPSLKEFSVQLGTMTLAIFYRIGLQTFPVKGQMINILSFVGYPVFTAIITLLLWHKSSHR